ncbi:beta-lactamase regulating signal transducer with metallopeptidase domain [Algoriphagus boseongensis]|uniref:Beta-lactamase regulating signal transducer with metallopeptidase domain n=1 Tax=Algoriphagus boseongensis TaxID=1442587 RepID=A0A4R6T592_9BACT|nr:M56 family metallopeptidase [Algoriphagus boseongensis]TDQ16449.1 beta-lactamase regulating signal transducer with metallopeptidase domain [Algoriphagus boseongensis]
MIAYLLKSILCLLVLLLIHRLILQREVLHRFNRFFLLGAVIGSFLIPLVTIEVGQEPVILEITEDLGKWAPDSQEVNFSSLLSNEAKSPINEPKKAFPWVELGFGIYGLISFLFFVRFIRNLNSIYCQIRNHTQVSYKGEVLVLLNRNTSPFSFLKYIFVSKSNFEQGISEAVFLHEKCHVKEKHSWDILLIEALMIPFWFHPGLYMAKQSVRLNHEFIADQLALKASSLSIYQQELLNNLCGNYNPILSSSLNFSLTRKRLKMMTKKSNPNKIKLSFLVLIPILLGVGFVFAEKVKAPINGQMEKEAKVYTLVNTTTFKGHQLKEYLTLYGQFQTKVNANRLFTMPSNTEIEALRKEFDALQASFLKLSLEERKKVQRVSFPYARIEKDGLVTYKKFEDLTEEERATLTGC